jgi:hypothetical protein
LQPNAQAILDQRHGMVAAGDLSDADMKRRRVPLPAAAKR